MEIVEQEALGVRKLACAFKCGSKLPLSMATCGRASRLPSILAHSFISYEKNR
jgi:hypothetical protein